MSTSPPAVETPAALSEARFEYEPGREPERYELYAPAAYQFEFDRIDRRGFLKLVTAGIVILSLQPFSDRAEAQESGRGRRRGGGGGNSGPQEIGAWLHIAADGTVTVYTGKVEVGQGIRTSLGEVVAEELHAPLPSIHLVMGDTELCPYDGGTVGSQTTPSMVPRLRRMAAAARELLFDLAAAEWKVDRSSLTALDGKVIQRETNRSIPFGELTHGEKLTRVLTADPPVTPAEQWKVAGHPAPRADGRAFVTGKHQYPSDIRLPGMVYGKILRPPAYGAALVSLDSTAAAAMPGVQVVRDGSFVGVTAPNSFLAERALQALKAEWKPGPPAIGHRELFEHLHPAAPPPAAAPAGDADTVRTQARYNVSYIAHCPLEPRAAVAQWEGGKLTVWTGTQRPFGVRSELATAFQIPEEQVHVLMPDMGSGYGGKHTGEAAVEAARLAKSAGKPVNLLWTREEEFTWAYFRPAGVIEVEASARRDGTISEWSFHNYNSGGSAVRSPYDIPGQVSQFHSTPYPLKQGSYRGLAATANHFARECAMDELARALGMDPLAFRLKNLKDERLRAVLEAATRTFGWGKPAPPGHGFGIGCGTEKGSYLATCAEVAVDRSTGAVKVVRAVSAFECGAIINPDALKNQVAGALVMGLGGALTEAIEFESGRILNPKFSKYRVPRFSTAPEIQVVLLDRKDLPSAGAGETPIVGIAPAVGNAIFAATGVRLRSMPLVPTGFRS